MIQASNQTIIRRVSMEETSLLKKVSTETFSSAFSNMNTEPNMKQYLSRAFKEEQIQKELLTPDSAFYFLTIKHEVIGYTKLNLGNAQTEKVNSDAIEIQRIYLYEKMQGKGYGRMLIEHAEGIGREHNCPIIWLGVWEKNDKSIRFYQNMGFKIFDQHEFPFGDEIQTDFLLKKALE